ncbi:hypothetical protein QQG55_4345 [Brugia pahangi]|uniref:Uncharacterized protein n=1 Tax=Brugia pahangi TaxID=6280 RepID=A0A0N4TT73_BRUPA|nr:unnamed protein product [Brugia pahangi]
MIPELSDYTERGIDYHPVLTGEVFLKKGSVDTTTTFTRFCVCRSGIRNCSDGDSENNNNIDNPTAFDGIRKSLFI